MTTTTTREEVIKAVLEYFEAHTDVFNDCMEELDNWNGYLGYDRRFLMDDFEELHYGMKIGDLVDLLYYGHDDDTTLWDACGNEHFGKFNPYRSFYYYDGCGNVVSTNYKDYSDYLTEETVEDILDNGHHIDSLDRLDVEIDNFDCFD